LEVDVSTSAVDGSVHPTETTNTDQEFSFEVNSPVVPAAEDEIDGTAKPPFWISKKFHITCCLGNFLLG
jgi:hypothetical protein